MLSNKLSFLISLTILMSLLATYKSECSSKDDYSGIFGECNKFLRCSNGIYFVFTCAPGTFFDYKRKICDYPQNVECLGPIQSTYYASTLVPTSSAQYCNYK